MTARDTYNSSVNTGHASAETGGISGLNGLAPPGNATTWSRAIARTAVANNAITQAQFVDVMGKIAAWEQEQISAAKSVLRNSGDSAPC